MDDRLLAIFLADAGDRVREWTEARDGMVREAHAAAWSVERIAAVAGLAEAAVAEILAVGATVECQARSRSAG